MKKHKLVPIEMNTHSLKFSLFTSCGLSSKAEEHAHGGDNALLDWKMRRFVGINKRYTLINEHFYDANDARYKVSE